MLKVSKPPARPQQRFTVHTDGPRGLEQIGSGFELSDEIAFAKRHHGATGQLTYIRHERTGSVVYRLERAQVKHAAGGAA